MFSRNTAPWAIPLPLEARIQSHRALTRPQVGDGFKNTPASSCSATRSRQLVAERLQAERTGMLEGFWPPRWLLRPVRPKPQSRVVANLGWEKAQPLLLRPGGQARRTAGVQGLIRCAHPRRRQGRGSPAGLTPRVPGLPRAYRSRRHPARKTPERGLHGHTRRRVTPGGEAEEGPCPLGLHRGSGGAAPRVWEAILRASKRRQDGCVGTR